MLVHKEHLVEIRDEDILGCDEIAINLVVTNRITVNLIKEGVSRFEIPVVSKEAGLSLMGQLLEYKEGLEHGSVN